MICQADLMLSAGGVLWAAVRGRGVELTRRHRYQTLCEAAVDACRHGRLSVVADGARRVGFIDAHAGRVHLAGGARRDVQSAWGAPIDLRQLESVALDRERDETQAFRRAVMTGNHAKIAQLGPRRGFRW